MTTQLTEKSPSRQAFEDRTWQYYRAKKANGFSRPEEGDTNSREALFWMNYDGTYGVQQIEAAWSGWQMAKADSAVALVQFAESQMGAIR
jgi:hypothetical protein